jgi:membrane associated rhomboid family serine protease
MTLLLGLVCIVFSSLYLYNQSSLNKALTTYCLSSLLGEPARTGSARGLASKDSHRYLNSCMNLMRQIHSASDKNSIIDRLVKLHKKHTHADEETSQRWRLKLIKDYERFTLLAPVQDYTGYMSYRAGSWNVLRMLSATTIHVDSTHWFMNLFFFLLFASIVELILGRISLLVSYLLFALGSHSVFSVYYAASPGVVYTMGLSGVVMGLMMLSLVLASSIQLTRMSWRYILVILLFLVLFVLADYFQSFYFPSEQPINYVAHASGAFLGLVIGFYYYLRYYSAKPVNVLVLTSNQWDLLNTEPKYQSTQPALNRVLRKAKRWKDQVQHLEKAVRHEFQLYNKANNRHKKIPEDTTPYGAIIQYGNSDFRDASFVLIANPVYMESGIDQLHVLPQDTLSITDGEAQQLIAELNTHFAEDGVEFIYETPYQWLIKVLPSSRLGRDIAICPIHEIEDQLIDSSYITGSDKTAWHNFINELQMLLHQSSVNQARADQGQAAINSVWFWGMGGLPKAIRSGWKQVYADDVLSRGLARLSQAKVSDTQHFARDLSQGKCEGQVLIVISHETLRKHGVALHGDQQGAQTFLEELVMRPLLEAINHKQITFCRLNMNQGFSLNFDKRILNSFWCC